MKKITPYYDRIQIEPIESESVLGDNKKPEMGTVVAVGSHVKFFKVGDIALFSEWGFRETTKIDDKIYCFVAETSEFILGRIRNGNNEK